MAQDSASFEATLGQQGKSQLNSQDTSEHKSDHSWMYHLNAWSTESAWCFLALVLLAAIFAILRYYESKTKKIWFDEISLNAVIAFAATLCRAAMVIPVSEGISQLKWNSFASGPRPFMDLYAFDQASRGPFGSFMLLSTTRDRLLGVSTLAAIVLVSGLVTSPLTQATIDYKPPPESSPTSANITRASGLSEISPGMKSSLTRAALRTVFTDAYEPEPFNPEPRCPAPKCQWDSFQALDICAITQNITHRTRYNQNPENWQGFDEMNTVMIDENDVLEINTTSTSGHAALWWSHGPEVPKNASNSERAASLGSWKHKDIFDVSESFFGGLYFVFAPDYAPPNHLLTSSPVLETFQVIWHWCIQDYTVEVKEGSPYVNAFKSTLRHQKRILSVEASDAESSTEYRVPKYSYDFVGKALRGGELGATSGPTNEIRDGLWKLIFPTRNLTSGEKLDTEDISHGSYSLEGQEDWQSYGERVETLAIGIAMALSNVLRDTSNGKNEHFSHDILFAKAHVGDPVLEIRWQWLGLLTTQVIFTILFLVYVVINTAKLDVEIVKSSNVAELLALSQMRGPQGEPRPQERFSSLGIRSSVDEEIHVELSSKNHEVWELELRPVSSRVQRSRWKLAIKAVRDIYSV